MRVLAFVGGLAALWLPLYGLFTALIDDANTLSIVVMAVLFVEFLLLLKGWNRWVYGCDRPWSRYGLQWNWRNGRGLLLGYCIGSFCLLLLFLVQQRLGWIEWTSWRYLNLVPQLKIGISGLLVALGVGLGEEIVFRGWLLDELERDYSASTALRVSSILFAVLHFIRPLSEIIRTFPQFPGLVMLGLVLVWAKRSHRGQLGIAIGLHAGLVWGYYWVNVGQLVQYQPGVPEWWSGIDRNPLAGLLSLGFLTILALWFRHRAIVAIRD
ncbi:MAG: CPBP family intramembrane metalloprotease [Cyanothece sp. SIO2G6]|nr:CPBP family intramembrane metalloprotease [Cyanothece sp. SIO2G6]